MELDQHGSDITEMTQSTHAENLKQGQDSVHGISPRLPHITHSGDSVESQTHSDSDQTCTSAEMDAAPGDVISEQATNELCLAQGNLACCNLSIYDVLRRNSTFLGRLEGLAAVTDRTIDNTAALDHSHSPRTADELMDLFDIYQHFQSSKNGTDSDLPALDTCILTIGHEGSLNDNDEIGHACRLFMLADLLWDRATISNAVEDVDRAIECLTTAARGMRGIPDLYVDLSQILAAALKMRHEKYGRAGDIDLAIEYQHQSVASAGDTHENYATIIAELGRLYNLRFRALGSLSDIDKAIEYGNLASFLIPETGDARISVLIKLGNSHRLRFERQGEPEDIKKAIECHISASRLTPEGHPGMPGRLSNLGNLYLCRFGCLGEFEDINKAIECHTSAFQLTPEGHPDTPNRLNNLGNSYMSRFGHLGELVDIDVAIECHTSASQLTPEGHPGLPARLSNLGNSHNSRFERLGKLEDINKAIECHTSAFQLTPEGHPDLPSHLHHLGTSYMFRFEHLGELADINKAIECHTSASRLTPEGHPNLPSRLNNLGHSYMCRFIQLRQSNDAEEAIKSHTRALHLLPHDHTQTPIIQIALGRSYIARVQCFKEPRDISKAIEYWEAAAHFSAGSPAVRLSASCALARLVSIFGLSASLPAHRISMQLLPEAIWLGMTSSRRYERITEIGVVAVEAAAAAISAKEYTLALEWLEEGRSIVWNQTLKLRTPFDILATVDLALAQNLRQVARDLELANKRIADASPIGVHMMSTEQATRQHHRLVGEYNQLIHQARELPDFHNFMRPKKAADLVLAARLGPVIIVNVHEDSCDALILSLQSDEVVHVPLPNLSQDSISCLQGLMMETLRAKGIRERTMARLKDVHSDHFNNILSSLWHKLVKPILDFLGFSEKLPVDQLPHITWCTTGALSFLPIHAAGDYGSGQDRIFHYAITSYTPTISALLATTPQPPAKVSGVLAVSQESTLPGTKDELAYIKKHVTGLPYMQLENDQATPTAVLDAMEQYECVHLACHASQNTAAPTQSCFHLHGGTLSLDDIAQRSLKNKSLAFLSACQTAAGDQKMPDEAIHLAAGMLIAGYPSVIATMWSIRDGDAPSVADEVYGQLVRDGKLDCSQVARALHVAVGALRASIGEDQFPRWVPYVHIGR